MTVPVVMEGRERSVMEYHMSDPMISTAELAERLGEAGLRLVDASWHLGDRDAKRDFLAGHIPGAVFFDIDAIADPGTDLPHMLPSPESFAEAAGALGISERDTIIVYDSVGMFSAARVWWTLRAMGATDVRVLDGGLPKWIAEGRPLEAGWRNAPHGEFKSRAQPGLVRDLDQVRQIVGDGSAQLVDARSAARFSAAEPEPRAGLRSGHMPGARNVPWGGVVASDGTLAAPETLREVFAHAGVDLSAPIVTTCGSGISAALLALALARVGRDDVAVYDGSWSEWGARADTPVAVGAP